MEPIIFTEEQLSDLEGIGKSLFNQENDPKSSSYIRKLNRPKISWCRVITWFLVPALIIAFLIFFSRQIDVPPLFVVMSILAFLIVYIIATLKRAIICAIKIYQRYAPDSLRNKCRFEPSCSEYMILAIEKYGLIKGLKKGINRLRRCNISGGGFDYP